MDAITAPPISTADNANIKQRFDDAVAARDVRGLSTLMANEGPDSLIGKAAFKQINDIQSRATEFKNATDPIEKAGPAGSPQRNIKAAQTFASTADQPLYGQALVAFMMGQKEDAYKLFTGGTPKTTIEYAKDNGNILQIVTNGLGQPLSYYDTQDGRQISLEEYSKRGGSVSSLDNTLAGMSQAENRQLYNAAYQTEKASLNNFTQAYDNFNPKIQYVSEWMEKNKADLPPDQWAALLRNVSSSMGTASTVSKSKTAFDQLQKDASTANGVRVDDKVAAQTGAAIGQVLKISGDKLISTDGKFNESLANLKQRTETNSQSAENSRNASETFNSIVQSEKFQAGLKGKTEKEKQLFVQQLQQVMRFSNEIGSGLSEAVDKYGKPAFISLPTTADFTDPQALLRTQMAQHQYNRSQLLDYKNYFNKNAELYDQTKTLPAPGAISQAFTNSGRYTDNKVFYGQAIDNILNSEYEARSKQSATPASAVDVLRVPSVAPQPAAVPPPAPVPAAAPVTAVPAPVAVIAPDLPAAAVAANAKKTRPKIGDLVTGEDGKRYVLIGADPNKKSNWKEVK
jgi:hypothetical protein